MLTRILILLFLLNINGFSQNKIPVEMIRHFAFQGEGTLFVNVKLLDGENELINKDFNILSDTSILRMYDTINVSTNSSLRYEIDYDNTLKKENIDFSLQGNENRLLLNSVFILKDSVKSLGYMTIEKIYNGNDIADLNSDTNYKDINRILRFLITNKSNEKIYGSGLFNNFWSDLYAYRNQKWELASMLAGMCGNVEYQQPLEKNKTTSANVEGILTLSIGTPLQLIPSKYKVINKFTFSPKGELIPSRNIIKRIFTYYEASLEFEIK